MNPYMWIKSPYCPQIDCVEVGVFAKSSFSTDGSCVEVGGSLRSSFCSSDGCVEVSAEGHLVLVRDTKDRSVEPVPFALADWKAYVTEIKDGLHSLQDGVAGYTIGHLRYDRGEWAAFLQGVNAGEFDLSPELEAELVSA